jgi:hypothetical protein
MGWELAERRSGRNLPSLAALPWIIDIPADLTLKPRCIRDPGGVPQK